LKGSKLRVLQQIGVPSGLPIGVPSFGNAGLASLGLLPTPLGGGPGGTASGSSSSDGEASSNGRTMDSNAAATGGGTGGSSGTFAGMGSGMGFAAGTSGEAAAAGGTSISGVTAGMLSPDAVANAAPGATQEFNSDAAASAANMFGAQFGSNIGGGSIAVGNLNVGTIVTGVGITGMATPITLSGTASGTSAAGGQGIGTNFGVGSAGGLSAGASTGAASSGGSVVDASTFQGTGGATGDFSNAGAASFGNGGILPSSSLGLATPSVGNVFTTQPRGGSVPIPTIPGQAAPGGIPGVGNGIITSNPISTRGNYGVGTFTIPPLTGPITGP
jgi:hypothetical protein